MEASAAVAVAVAVALKHVAEDDALLPIAVGFASSVEGDVDFTDIICMYAYMYVCMYSCFY